MAFSIFIASSTTTVWPLLTASPSLTQTSRITPGSGEVTAEPAPPAAGFGAGAAAGAEAAGAAAFATGLAAGAAAFLTGLSNQ